MTIGIGVDVVLLKRIDRSLEKYGARFAEKILHPDELLGFLDTKSPVAFLGKRFAAKEAVAKALGTGMKAGVNFSDIQVVHESTGRPGVRLHGAAQEVANRLGITQIHLSISDEKTLAIAYVVADGLS